MRRIGLLVVFLALLSLTTAFAASFDVQAEDITSFSTTVSISLPPEQFAEMRLIGLADVGELVLPPATDEDPRTKTAKFQPNADPIGVEDDPPGTGGRVHYVTWISDTFDQGLAFPDPTVALELDRKDSVELTAGLFDCPATEPRATLTPGCELIGIGNSTQQDIPIVVTGAVSPGHQLRLKIVNRSGTESTIQWGYNAARLVRLVAP